MSKESRDQPTCAEASSATISSAAPAGTYSAMRPRGVYVAGPVIRDPTGNDDWAESVIALLEAEARKLGVRLILPTSEPELEKAEPRAFFREVSARIGGADAVISVFSPDDPATVVEASLAAMYGKPQLILARFPDDVPRLLRGMPAEVAVAASARNRQHAVADFLGRARGASRDEAKSPKPAG